MVWTQLWLLVSLAFASVTSLPDGSPLKVMSSPNLLRIGAPENIFVECQDCSGRDIPVTINIKNHPTKSQILKSTSVNLTRDNDFQAFGEIKIPAGDFSRDPSVKQYVHVEAMFPDIVLEKVVLLAFQTGYIFIQTDKSIYTPKTNVLYRMFTVTPRMEPVERAEGDVNDATSINIEIVTPDNVVLPVESVSPKSGVHSGNFVLGDIRRPGVWKLVAKFQTNPRESYTAEFEVKEHVLPSFEVKLTPESSFFYVDSPELVVNIKAKYLSGEKVEGTAYVVFGIQVDNEKKGLPGSLKRLPVKFGESVARLRREHITQTFPNMDELVGNSIYVSVSVLTESGSEMAETELRGIQIVKSPYTILFKKTPKYFKPGMSFDVAVEVVNPDGSPAQGVAVEVEPGTVRGFTAANGIARVSINTDITTTSLSISAKTHEPRISAERQAKATMQALPYASKSNSFIHIGVGAELTRELKLGGGLKVNLYSKRQTSHDTDITYLITSKGHLVKHGRFRAQQQTLIVFYITITKEMLPSFRIIAYFHPSDDEVVSDSVWIEVTDTCIGTLKLEQLRPAAVYEPLRGFDLKITGDPGARGGLVAVDKGVYVLNTKYRITQKKVWDVVKKYDTGCTSGGGKDGMNVFYDAGLMFESSTASGTPYRQEKKCSAPVKRKRRASAIMDVSTSLRSRYRNNLQRGCCVDGMRETLLSYSCERRSEYITDGVACVEAFLHCCKKMEQQRAEMREHQLHLARSEEDAVYMDSNEISSRSNFPESWLWSDFTLRSCPPHSPMCDSVSEKRTVSFPGSITTWVLTGMSLSRTYGLCVSEPLEINVQKMFFIDLRLPYSAVRGEQLEVKAILHNYTPEPLTVRVELRETPDVCSAASKRTKFREEVSVGAQTTRSVPFIIIPMKEGEHNIELKATARDSWLNDGVRKKLRVVPEGILVKSSQIIILDPKGGKQEEIVNSKIARTNMVPNTPTSTQISVTGRESVSPLVENTITGNVLGSLIIQPSGCGEQNMIRLTLPVIAATYLDKTNQWEAVGFLKRNKALHHIKTGYKNELAYRKNDGSFAMHPNVKSSTWLTAYVIKIFSLGNSLVAAPDNVICDAVRYIIINAQHPDGRFSEVGKVFTHFMMGDVQGADADASMTAFCLIPMQESRALCRNAVSSMRHSMDMAVKYLERRLPYLTNPYAVAMTSYALANENKLNKEILFRFASPDRSYWHSPKGQIFSVEATAYALLALIKNKDFEDAKPVVRWFNKHERVGGGYGSTQATVMVYQAIAEYWTSDQEQDYKLKVDVHLPGRADPNKFFFMRENSYTTRTLKMNDINQDVKVTAEGSGEATLRMLSLYYEIPKDSDCQKFNLSVELIPEKMDEAEPIYKLRIKVLYKDRERDAAMSILDIGLLTGFTANTNDLDLMLEGRAFTISKYQMDTDLSDRGSLIIHLDRVSHTRPEEITFRLHQTMKVGVLQPAAVSVYEYFDQQPCVKFYHPQRRAGQLLRLCRNHECTCAEENCSMQKKGHVDNDLRIAISCESTPTSKIDIVYKVSVEDFRADLTTDIYTMRVLNVIKRGLDEDAQGKLRTFLGYPHCRESLGVGTGKTYLIMGTSKDIYLDDVQQTYQYVLGERTWIEYWPTNEECLTPEYGPTCLGLQELEQSSGCIM